MTKPGSEHIFRIMVKLVDRAVKQSFKGYDPLVLEDLYFAKRFVNQPNTINRLLRHFEKFAIFIVPFWFFARFYKLPKLRLLYGDALFIQGLIKLYKKSNELIYLDYAKQIYEESVSELIALPNGLGAGNPKQVKNFKSLVKGKSDATGLMPTTCEFALAVMDLNEAVGGGIYLGVITKLVNSIVNDFNPKVYGERIVFDYSTAGDNSHILNANALAGIVLTRYGNLTNDRGFDVLINGLYNFLKPYIGYEIRDIPYAAVEDKNRIRESNRLNCDVFHTGFTLRGFKALAEYLQRSEDLNVLRNRAEDYFNHFLNDKKVIFSKRSWFSKNLMDIHGVAEYIYTYSVFKKYDANVFASESVLMKNINLMYNGNYFRYRRLLFLTIDVYMPRWGEAAMLNALSSLYEG